MSETIIEKLQRVRREAQQLKADEKALEAELKKLRESSLNSAFRIKNDIEALSSREYEIATSYHGMSTQVSKRESLRVMANQIIEGMTEQGYFGNSLKQRTFAKAFLEEAIKRHLDLNYSFIGTGTFRLKEIAQEPWAQDLGMVPPAAVGYVRSSLSLSAGNTLRLLIRVGAIDKIGHDYQLGDLRNVVARF